MIILQSQSHHTISISYIYSYPHSSRVIALQLCKAIPQAPLLWTVNMSFSCDHYIRPGKLDLLFPISHLLDLVVGR